MRVAGGPERAVKIRRIGVVRIYRRQVGAAAEPALRRFDAACIHMHGRHQRRAHMRDKADAAGHEGAAVLRRARNLRAEPFRKRAVDGGDIDADFLKNAAVHQRHLAAAARAAVFVPAIPFFAREAPGGQVAVRAAERVLQPLEGGADAVAQGCEPLQRLFMAGGLVGGSGRYWYRYRARVSPAWALTH
jgi:hypothetical protein